MSFGLQVFNASGGLALDDKSFSIIGRVVTLSGSGSFLIGPGFVALGVSGAALVGKELRWHTGGGRVYYFILVGGALDVVIFEDSSMSTAKSTMGLEIFSESGVGTFSSGDRHFEIISQTSLWNFFNQHSEPLNRGTVYILHSSRMTGVEPWYYPFGTKIGVDILSADSQTVHVKPKTLVLAQGVPPVGLSRLWRGTPSSQLLRVRSK